MLRVYFKKSNCQALRLNLNREAESPAIVIDARLFGIKTVANYVGFIKVAPHFNSAHLLYGFITGDATIAPVRMNRRIKMNHRAECVANGLHSVIHAVFRQQFLNISLRWRPSAIITRQKSSNESPKRTFVLGGLRSAYAVCSIILLYSCDESSAIGYVFY